MERIPLISSEPDEIYTNTAFEYDDEDYSSGYDSTDISDAESVTSWGSRDSLLSTKQESSNNLLPADDKAEMMSFHSTHALSEHLKLILAMPEMCDVTFLVGPREVPVHGVRAIMGTRSRVLYQLILKHMSMRAEDDEINAGKIKKTKKTTSTGIGRPLSQRLVIPVKKYDAEVFRMLIQFVHCGSATITESTVAGLFCAACQFVLPDLSKACMDFVERCLKSGRAKEILFSARCYSHHKAATPLFDKIYSILDRRYVAQLEETPV